MPIATKELFLPVTEAETEDDASTTCASGLLGRVSSCRAGLWAAKNTYHCKIVC